VEEDVPSAIVRTQEAKALGIEIGDHRAGLLAGRRFIRFGAFARRRGLSRGLVANPLFDQGQVGFSPARAGWASAGIARFGLRFRASSNIRF